MKRLFAAAAVVAFAGAASDPVTVQGTELVYTIGRLAAGAQQVVQIKTRLSSGAASGTVMTASASLTSATAQPLALNTAATRVVRVAALP